MDYLLGVAPTSTLRRHVESLEASTAARFAASDGSGKLRRFTEFYDGAASWDRVERIVARVEAGSGRDGHALRRHQPAGRFSPRPLRAGVLPAGPGGKPHQKHGRRHLAADRTSCSKATANQFRLFLHGAAYWLMWSLRTLMPRRSSWRTAQFDTLRLRLIKLAVRVVETENPGQAAPAQPAPRASPSWPSCSAACRA